MPWTTTTPILIWAATFLPLFIVLWIFPPRVKLTAVLVGLAYLVANLYFILLADWSLINYWLRVVPAVLAVLLAIRLWSANRAYFDFHANRIMATPFLPGGKKLRWVVLLVSILVLLVFTTGNILALRSLRYKGPSDQVVTLFYPLRYGMYVVTNGGNGLDGIGMNDTYRDWLGRPIGNRSMAYAVDLMKMRNDRGRVSDGTLPTTFVKYEGYGDLVFAPCNGTVVHIVNGLPDAVMGKPSDPLGNRIVFHCGPYYVTVANLKNDSIIVKMDEEVNFRQQIGLLGSSGSPSIPHLRIFTNLNGVDGPPVPQLFDLNFRFLVRNDLVLPNY